jgi:hypothetical protein
LEPILFGHGYIEEYQFRRKVRDAFDGASCVGALTKDPYFRAV